jgi:hypothetical protein
MPNIAPPARYDVPWKTAATHASRPFLEFYFPALSAQTDWRQRPRFRDKELAGLGFGAVPIHIGVRAAGRRQAFLSAAPNCSITPPIPPRWRLRTIR